jgi:PEP-CTERM motif-containing protein
MRLLLALMVVLVLAGPVDAILVEGTITAGIPTDFAPIMNLRGEEGFSLRTGITGDSFHVFLPTVNINQPYDGLSKSSRVNSLGSVTYQGETFPLTNVTGQMTFDVEPFFFREASPGIPGVAPPRFVGDSPFTMTGQLSFTGHTVALEGSGVLTAGAFGEGPPIPFAHIDQVAYNFTPIPEPGTLVLFGTATGLGALYRLRKRRGGR